eukprot:1160983-Pelagomonas_calceolata.AAC.12
MDTLITTYIYTVLPGWQDHQSSPLPGSVQASLLGNFATGSQSISRAQRSMHCMQCPVAKKCRGDRERILEEGV